jgi:flagellar protein FliO/FliZ
MTATDPPGAMLAWLLRRLATRGPRAEGGRRLRLTETIALDPRRRLHLVSCDGRSLLYATGGPADVLIGWVPDGPAA